ncbi:MAG: RNA pseudouridine synthase [Cyclobacteriaceae bacterium]|nr:RNA pseudouridine synthase [Cyclobacteriaceae bacterium]
MTLNVLYEDNHLLVINKPAGMLSQSDKTGDLSLVDNAKKYLKEKYKKPGNVFCGLVHRLDRPVSGVIILARTSKALERMNKQFQERSVNKIYEAMINERPGQESGTLTHWLVKDHTINKVKASNKLVKNGVKAVLDYELTNRTGSTYLLEIKLHTGRPHQIRTQLAKAIGPIIGDNKYGWKGKNDTGSIALHAKKIEFTHPVTKQQIVIEASTDTNPFWKKLGIE